MIVLSAGHTPDSPGACSGSFCEHAEAVEWVNRIAYQLRHDLQVQIVASGPLSQKVREINETHQRLPVQLAVEIHFNSDPQHAGHGSETLYCPGSAKGERAAQMVQRHLGSTMRPDRGVKEGWYRMDRPGHVDYPGDVEGDEKVDYFLRATKPVALIVEPEFIHNRRMILAYRDLACLEIAFGINRAVAAIA